MREMFVPTRSSVLKNKSEESCATVVFKKKKTERPAAPLDVSDDKHQPEPSGKEGDKLDMKKLRYEVIKFGSTGLGGSKKVKSRVALAVALGAAPPKKMRQNYKRFLEEKKVQKEKQDRLNKLTATKIIKKGTSNGKKPRGKGTGGLLNSYGKVNPNKQL